MVLDTIKRNERFAAELSHLSADGRRLEGITNLLDHEKTELHTLLSWVNEKERETELEEKTEKAFAVIIKEILDDIEKLTWELHMADRGMDVSRVTRGLSWQAIGVLNSQMTRISMDIFNLKNKVKSLDKYLDFFAKTSRAYEGKMSRMIIMLQDIRKWGNDNVAALELSVKKIEEELKQMHEELTSPQ